MERMSSIRFHVKFSYLPYRPYIHTSLRELQTSANDDREDISPNHDIARLKEVIIEKPFAQKNSKAMWIHIVAKINAMLFETRYFIMFIDR